MRERPWLVARHVGQRGPGLFRKADYHYTVRKQTGQLGGRWYQERSWWAEGEQNDFLAAKWFHYWLPASLSTGEAPGFLSRSGLKRLGESFMTCLQLFFPLNHINIKQLCLPSSSFFLEYLVWRPENRTYWELWYAKITVLLWMCRACIVESQDSFEFSLSSHSKIFSVSGRIPGRTQRLFWSIRWWETLCAL